MKTPPSTHQDGNVLILALIGVILVTTFAGIAFSVTGNTPRMTDSDRKFSATKAAAEGSIEYAFGVWRSIITQKNKQISTTEANASLSQPAFDGVATPTGSDALKIDAVDAYGAPAATPVPVYTNITSHPGWVGLSYNYAAHVRMQSSNARFPAKVGVRRTFQYVQVPLFQSMYFFEDNLEFYRPAQMIVSGLVHTNNYAYMSSSDAGTLTFQGNVSYVTGYSETADPPYASSWSGYVRGSQQPPTYSTSKSSQLNQVTRMEPLGTDPVNAVNTTDANPNNDGMEEIIQVPDSNYTDPDAFATRRYYNKAGIVIKLTTTSTTTTTGSGRNRVTTTTYTTTPTITGQNGTTLTAAQKTAISGAIGTQFQMYDQREGTSAEVTNFDVGAFKNALTSANITGFNNVLYIYDDTNDSAAKAIKLTNGGVLPDGGLTVASQDGVYIEGDYNTGTTTNPSAVPSNVSNANNTASPTVSSYTRQPSAVAADAVMLLSNNWSDSNASSSLSNRTATNTTYNTAILAGFMPSGYDPTPNNTTNGDNYGYSGGGNNFPRFLENWSNKYCTYYGSMVELYQSNMFTGEWDTGVIYSPPLRRWNYDTNFTTNPPPGSLDAISWSRGVWQKY